MLFPHSVACAVAGLSKDRLNEDIAAGKCSFAPATTNGVERLWTKSQIGALWYYSAQRAGGLSKAASWFRCARLLDALDRGESEYCDANMLETLTVDLGTVRWEVETALTKMGL
jgi:hypothetical protein